MKISSWGLPCGADMCVCAHARAQARTPWGPRLLQGSGKPEMVNLKSCPFGVWELLSMIQTASLRESF